MEPAVLEARGGKKMDIKEMDIKEKLLANILICKALLDDIEKEVGEIYKTDRGYWSYSNSNKDIINRSRIVIGEKLLEIEKVAKEHKQEI